MPTQNITEEQVKKLNDFNADLQALQTKHQVRLIAEIQYTPAGIFGRLAIAPMEEPKPETSDSKEATPETSSNNAEGSTTAAA